MLHKKVLILCNSSSGLNDFRGMLIDQLQQYDYEVAAVVPITEDENELSAERNLEKRGCNLIKRSIDRRGTNPISDLKLFNCYRELIEVEKPDMVITYTIKPNIYGGCACRLLKIPYIMNITGLGTAFESSSLLKEIVTFMYKIACKSAKIVFFENEDNRQLFINEKIVKQQQTHRLNGAGVDIDKYTVSDYPQGEEIVFLFIGRVMAEKGIDELFSSMKRLVAEGFNCKLDVLGGYEEDYKDKIEQYEAEGWLRYYGYQKDVRPYIKKCHCFILPSWHEGMANTNLESAASGRPIITSNIPGCMEAALDCETGFLVERKNVDDLYKAMKKFIELPYDCRKAMGLAGRKHMEEIFDKKKVVKETIDLIVGEC